MGRDGQVHLTLVMQGRPMLIHLFAPHEARALAQMLAGSADKAESQILVVPDTALGEKVKP
jgi:hypothetical protein